MKGKQWRSKGAHNTPTMEYSVDNVKNHLNKCLAAVEYWQTECLKHETYIRKLETDIRILKEQGGVVRLPFGGFIK